jgi:hypothetical protein
VSQLESCVVLMKSARGSARAATPDPRAMPTGFAIGLGAVLMVVAGLIAAAVPGSQPAWRFAVIAVAVGVFALGLDLRALAGVALIGFLISNGFLEDEFGDLTWHGYGDLWRVVVLVMAGACGWAVGTGFRHVRKLRARSRVATAIAQSWRGGLDGERMLPSLMEEEEHGA